MKLKLIPYIFFLNFLFAQFSININVNNQGSFSIPFSIKYAINEKFSIEHVNRFYKINHPHNRFLYASKIRNDMTMITEKSFILYKENNINLKFGRDYIQPDVGSISDPYFSGELLTFTLESFGLLIAKVGSEVSFPKYY